MGQEHVLQDKATITFWIVVNFKLNRRINMHI